MELPSVCCKGSMVDTFYLQVAINIVWNGTAAVPPRADKSAHQPRIDGWGGSFSQNTMGTGNVSSWWEP